MCLRLGFDWKTVVKDSHQVTAPEDSGIRPMARRRISIEDMKKFLGDD
jgi:hypothetical protein